MTALKDCLFVIAGIVLAPPSEICADFSLNSMDFSVIFKCIYCIIFFSVL